MHYPNNMVHKMLTIICLCHSYVGSANTVPDTVPDSDRAMQMDVDGSTQ